MRKSPALAKMREMLEQKKAMKYFWIKLSHNNGTSYLKTIASSKEKAINNIMMYENCPQQAIECKEVGKELFTLDIKTHFKNTL